MAIGQSDGSIVLDLTVNDQGLKKETKNLKSEAAKLAAEYRKAGMSQSEAFKKAWSEIERTKVSTDKVTVSTKKFGQQSQTTGTQASAAIAKIGLGLKSLLTYFIGIQTVFAAIRFSGGSAELATQTEASVQRLVDIYGSASDAVGDFIDANARALGMSKAAAASFSSVYGNLFSVWADQATNAELTNRYLNMTAVVASKTGRTVEDVQERVRSGLLGNTEAIEDLGIFVNVKTIEMTDAFQRMANGKSWEQLDAYAQQQIRSMAILEQATAKYGDEVANTSATTRNQYKAAYEDFKNSWGNIVNTVLLPVLRGLTQIFNIATAGLNALTGRSGQILENSQIQEENTDKTAENIEQQTKNQKGLNKELKKATASFDDIEILSANTAENISGGTDSGLQDIGGDLASNSRDDSIFEETPQKIQDLAKVVAKAMIVIGCVLLATGNIGWGVGFIIAGAAAEGIVESAVGDGSSFQEIADKISNAIIIAGVVAIILGILLCMAQMWGLGIKLIAIGAISVGGSVALNWDGIKEKLQGSFGGWLVLGGIIAIVLGILLCFNPTTLPLGIGLIFLGAGSIVAPIVANWDAILGWLQKAWGAVQSFWNRYIAPVFTAKFWLDLGKTCINGLIAGFEGGINGIIGAFEKMINWIVDGLNKISFDIPEWLGGGSFGINLPRASFGRVSIPRLAQGAVIPPNREFLAVLGDQKQGTNIEAPLQTIVDAFNIALSQNGGASRGNTEVVLEIDGREFGRAVVEQGNRENRRIGTRLVIG